uniref:VWFA domain-containing protein n=1 Tax=Eptatretus burgeri TaxID=7764 RepID=A0A8C4WYC0_EPTBU
MRHVHLHCRVILLCAYTTGYYWLSVAAFNLDTSNPVVFHGPAKAQFGYTVQQHNSGDQKWLLVGAPLTRSSGERPGDIYRCRLSPSANRNCKRLHLDETISIPNVTELKGNMALGMTILPEPVGNGFTVCAPLWAQQCGTSYYTPGICGSVDSNFTVTHTEAPSVQSCGPYKDIVIILDGSNSIYPWSDVRHFLMKTVQSFHIGVDQTRVGVVQYGEYPVHEFTLENYRTSAEVVKAAGRIEQLRGNMTQTGDGIDFARVEAFSKENGARRNAKKVMIVVTDGESHNKHKLKETIKACEGDNIERYAIAVLRSYSADPEAVRTLVNEVRSIASDPVEKHFFNVTSEATLVDIVGTLEDRIFSLEGTENQNGTAFDMEMSQTGFSAHYAGDTLLLGAVGAYEWAGTIVQQVGRDKIIPSQDAFEAALPLELRKHTAYLGYSLNSFTLRNGTERYVAGAPRYNHSGLVVIFAQGGSTASVTVLQTLKGNQIGSYFGGELCTMDVNGDGVSDLLLVAAPMFMDPEGREMGKVYVFAFRKRSWRLEMQLCPANDQSQASRFGSALASIPDLNHDGFGELAVGAPLSDGGQGALYLFRGRERTLDPRPSQHVAAKSLAQRLHFFGRSIHGKMDMDGNGIADVSVGALGNAVLLRSRSIAFVETLAKFIPSEVDIWNSTCQRGSRSTFCCNISLCFRASTKSPNPERLYLDLSYSMEIDFIRALPRAHFDKVDDRKLQENTRLWYDRTQCFWYTLYTLEATDYVKPLGFRTELRLDKSSSGPVLDSSMPSCEFEDDAEGSSRDCEHKISKERSERSCVDYKIPFKKDCGLDDECVTNLVLHVKSNVHGTSKLPFVVAGFPRLQLNVTLENHLENAYNTKLNITYSRNLHFACICAQTNKEVETDCQDHMALTGKLCKVDYPVFTSNTEVTWTIEFEFSDTVLLDYIEVDMEVTSDSEEDPKAVPDNEFHLFVPIRYEANLVMLRQTNVDYIEIEENKSIPKTINSLDDIGPQFNFTVQIHNIGKYDLGKLQLNISVPVYSAWNNPIFHIVRTHTAPRSKMHCKNGHTGEEFSITFGGRGPRFLMENLRTVREMNCQTVTCMSIRCWVHGLAKTERVQVTVFVRLWKGTFHMASVHQVRLASTVVAAVLNTSLLIVSEDTLKANVTVEIIKRGKYILPFWVILVSVLGGLLLLGLIILGLWKLGFLKRPEKYQFQKAEVVRPS